MDTNNENKLQEQEAPLKNHDNAYVQVGKNGEPIFPQKEENEQREPDNDNNASTQSQP